MTTPMSVRDLWLMQAKRMPEKRLMLEVIRLGKLFGWSTYHTYRSTKSTPGFPDLVIMREGEIIVSELKRQRAKPTAAQEHWLSLFRSVGVHVYVWRPIDLLDGTISKRLGVAHQNKSL